MRKNEPFVSENLRLIELVAVAEANKPFFVETVEFLRGQGYASLKDFVFEASEAKGLHTLKTYFEHSFSSTLFDGVMAPYQESKAKWMFISWLFRDAALQRLQPLVSQETGSTLVDKKASLLNKIRRHIAPLFKEEECWMWPAIREVLIARLEGSRRAKKGTLFEGIIRVELRTQLELLKCKNLTVLPIQQKIDDETYDVVVSGDRGKVLIPVKTRETMGGGHALLFTRDIFKSIQVAQRAGHECIPIVIAESWGGKLGDLECNFAVHIQRNPNQIDKILPELQAQLKSVAKAVAKALNK